MAESRAQTDVLGLIAEFDRPERLLESVRLSRDAGFLRVNAYTPFPIDGLAEALEFRDRRVPWLTLIGGVFGAALGYGMQVYTNLAYPIDIGGRPIVAPPAFMLITFELMVLFAVLFSIGGMLVLNRLPRLHHPLFDVQDFHLASSSKFFLMISSDDRQFDRDRTLRFLEGMQPVRIDFIGHGEMRE